MNGALLEALRCSMHCVAEIEVCLLERGDKVVDENVCSRNSLGNGIPKKAANAEAISELEIKLAAASEELKRLQHIEGDPLQEFSYPVPSHSVSPLFTPACSLL